MSHRASGGLDAGVQVENIESVAGAQRALDLSFDSETHELSAEAWNAQLFALSHPEDDHSPLDRELIASAAIVRVNRGTTTG